jgi:hypothetical protein
VDKVDAEVTALSRGLALSAVDVKMSAVAVEMPPTTDLSDHFLAAPPPKRLPS